jgi:two-component system, NarL family, invasion response regulator UvrY
MKIIIAYDHSIIREGIKQIILKNIPEITQIHEAVNGNDALTKVTANSYNLIIIDIDLPDLSGLDLLQKMRNRDVNAPVLILSFFPPEQYAIRAYKLGASGYLGKESSADEMLHAIRKIFSGGKYVSPLLAERLILNDIQLSGKMPHEELSDREFQVMIMLSKGKSLVEIGKEIFISDKTVSTYRTRIMEKMGLKNNTELTIYSLKNNLIE